MKHLTTHLIKASLVISLITAAIPAQAQDKMTRLQFSTFTTTYPAGSTSYTNDTRIDFYFVPMLLNRTLEPSEISLIQITANGTTIGIDPYQAQDALSNSYFITADSAQFGTPFPTKYTISVTDNQNKKISQIDYIPAVALTAPVQSWPTDNATINNSSPSLGWQAVPNAHYYRVMLWDNTWDQPVFWNFNGLPTLNVDGTFVKLPLGVLKPNHQYKWRIEARANEQDTDRRSRSAWRTFTTGTW